MQRRGIVETRVGRTRESRPARSETGSVDAGPDFFRGHHHGGLGGFGVVNRGQDRLHFVDVDDAGHFLFVLDVVVERLLVEPHDRLDDGRRRRCRDGGPRGRGRGDHFGDVDVELVGLETDGSLGGDVADAERSDLHDVAGIEGSLGGAVPVDEQPVTAAEVAHGHFIANHLEFGVATRQQGVVVTEIAHRIAADHEAFDEQQLTLALPVVDDQQFAHGVGAFYSLFELSTSGCNRSVATILAGDARIDTSRVQELERRWPPKRFRQKATNRDIPAPPLAGRPAVLVLVTCSRMAASAARSAL